MGIFNKLFRKKTKDEKVVNDSELSLPPWFHEECLGEDVSKNPIALSNLLNSSRQDVYSALSLYQVPVRYATTLIISIWTVIGVVFSLVRRIGVSPNVIKNLEMGAGLLFLVTAFIGFVSAFVITQYYKVYVSALVYATQIHSAVGMAGFYWFKRLMELLSKESMKKRKKERPEISRVEFISLRTLSWRDSNFWYMALLIVMGILGAIGCYIMWACRPFSNGLV